MIHAYVKEFSRWAAGSRAHRDAVVRELEAHLREAEIAGQLEETLERLGSPRQAARAFSEGHPLVPAAFAWRAAAAMADLLPLGVLLSIAYWHPDWPGGDDLLDVTRFVLIGLAVLWWNLVLPIAEGRTGRTPGKAMFGLRVMSDDGTAISRGQAFLRRVTVFFGFPLLLLDLPIALHDQRHRRAFDRVAGTLVVADPHEEPATPRARRNRNLKAHLVTFLFGMVVLVELWGIGTLEPGNRLFWPILPMIGWSLALVVIAWMLRAGSPTKG